MPAAAFFDLDRTILARSSALAFAGPLFRAGLITRRDVVRSLYAQFSLATGRIDHAAMELIREHLSALVAGWDTAVLRGLIADQLDAIVTPFVFAEAVELIAAHQAAGDAVVIVTSNGAEMADPIGALLGVDDVLSTRMGEQDGHYTGVIEDYMYGPRKAEAVEEWARAAGCDLADCAAYSDSSTDLPLLQAVGHPHAVNPDRALRRVADSCGWPVHTFRAAPGLNRRPSPSAAVGGIAAGASLVVLTTSVVYGRRRRKRLPN